MAQRPSNVQPNPDNGYRLYGDDRVTADLFNGIFTSLHNRLVKAEGKSADYDAAVDRIINQALQTVAASLDVEIQGGRAALAAVRDAFEELQSGGFSADRIAAVLDGQSGVGNVQQALGRLLSIAAKLAERVYELEPIASEDDARAGTDEVKRMPAVRVAQAIDALAGAEQTINVNADMLAERSKRYRFVGAAARTLSLPANPRVGDTIGLTDGGTTATHTLSRNGRTILGLAENLFLDAPGFNVMLWWTGTTWRLS